MMDIVQRLAANVITDPETGCWNWKAGKDTHGYGQMNANGRKRLAHRISFEVHRGLIPEGKCVCHRCDNPACINPDHLFIGTQAENVADMIAKRRDRKASQKGEAHGQAKLTEADVIAIRSNAHSSQSDLAARYGVSPSQIGNIRRGKRWTHVQVA